MTQKVSSRLFLISIPTPRGKGCSDYFHLSFLSYKWNHIDKWNHTICTLLCQAFFTEHNVCMIHHGVGSISSLLLFIAKWYSTVWINHNLCIQSPVDGHLGCFQLWATVNKAVLNILEQVVLWTHFHFSLINIQKWIVRSRNQCLFNFIRNWQIFSQSNCSILCHHKQCLRVPVALHHSTLDMLGLSKCSHSSAYAEI